MKKEIPSGQNPQTSAQDMGGPTLKAGLNSPLPEDADNCLPDDAKAKKKQKDHSIKQ